MLSDEGLTGWATIPIRSRRVQRETEFVPAKGAAELCSAWTGEGARPHTSQAALLFQRSSGSGTNRYPTPRTVSRHFSSFRTRRKLQVGWRTW